MNRANVCYLPSDGHGFVDVFLNNLNENPACYKTLLFCEAEIPGTIKIPKISTEILKLGRGAVKNAPFYYVMRKCQQLGIQEVLYLEDDCRVYGTHWDVDLWSQWDAVRDKKLIIGSLVIANIQRSINQTSLYEQYLQLLEEDLQSGNDYRMVYLMSSYVPQTFVYCNGALSIMNVNKVMELFSCDDFTNIRDNPPFDAAIGYLAFQKYGTRSIDLFGILNKVVSHYLNEQSTEDDRKKWLLSKHVRAIHPVKTNWKP